MPVVIAARPGPFAARPGLANDGTQAKRAAFAWRAAMPCQCPGRGINVEIRRGSMQTGRLLSGAGRRTGRCHQLPWHGCEGAECFIWPERPAHAQALPALQGAPLLTVVRSASRPSVADIVVSVSPLRWFISAPPAKFALERTLCVMCARYNKRVLASAQSSACCLCTCVCVFGMRILCVRARVKHPVSVRACERKRLRLGVRNPLCFSSA
jgi:hypothetical protein